MSTLPYKFEFIGGVNNRYTFTTTTGFVYLVTFKPTPYLFGELSPFANNTVELSLNISFNLTEKNPPFDKQTAQTVAAIFTDFYKRSEDSITIYICASYDGRQLLRHQVFHRWFSQIDAIEFLKFDEVISTSSGERFPVSLIIKKNNPYWLELLSAFRAVIGGYTK